MIRTHGHGPGILHPRLLATALLALTAGTACSDDPTGPVDTTAEPFEIAFVSGAKLHVVRTDGSGMTRLTDDEVGDRWYAWSPDGSRIAVERSGGGVGPDLFVMNADGSGAWNVTESPGTWDGRMSWSPDGGALAYGHPNDEGGWDIHRVGMDGSPSVNLTPPADATHDGWPVWSPDGSRIAFVSLRDGQAEIYVMDADGSNPVNLTGTPDMDEGYPAWSPDGSRIAFSSDHSDERDIHVINVDGTGRRTLTSQADRADYPPLWSPDGSRILFTGFDRDANTSDVFVIDADGTSLINLSNHPAQDRAASWAPDGSLIAFNSSRDGLAQVYLVAPDGSELRRLIEPEPDETPLDNYLESAGAWRPVR